MLVTGLVQRDGDIMDAHTGDTTFLLVGFAGSANDVDLLLSNVLLRSINSTFSANYIVRQQLP
jgi:hypothetical protein